MDTQLVGQLYSKYYSRMMSVAFNMLQDEQEAQDAIGGLFLKLCKKKDFDWNIKVVFKSLINHCRDINKKAVTRSKTLKGASPLLASEMEEPYIDRSTLLSKMYEEIEKLPPKPKEVIKRVLLGIPSDQQAAKSKVSRQTILNQKTRAITLLKRMMEPLTERYYPNI